jgi:2-amino-4-hydroxy-6-hydroxymethyldihydropteridine diphosphokinase
MRSEGCRPLTGSARVFLGLGTNLGDRAANLGAVCAAMTGQVRLVRTSRIYQTPPWGYIDQPAFLNQVIEVETSLSPVELLTLLKQLETRLGRVPTFLYGPRLIDIDILLYDQQVLILPQLTIPHPRLEERAFMLVPLAEIAPTVVHPTSGFTIQEILARIDSSGVEEYHAEG